MKFKKNLFDRLNTFWGFDYLRMELRGSWDPGYLDRQKNAEFLATDWQMLALGISCKGSSNTFKNGKIIWEGYKEGNNFLGMFSDYIDDSVLKIQTVVIGPFGNLEIELRDKSILDKGTLIHLAIYLAIAKNIKSLFFK